MVEPKLQPAVIGALIGQLRSLADFDARAGEPLGLCMREAADALEAISAENAMLREALKSAYREGFYDGDDSERDDEEMWQDFEACWEISSARAGLTALDAAALKEPRA